MNKRIVRATAAITAVAMGSLALQFVGPTGIAAAGQAVGIQCAGVSGDVAGSVSGAPKSSKDLVGLISTVTGSPGLPALPVDVTHNVPDKVKKGSGLVDVSFTFLLSFPEALVKTIKDTLKKTSLDVVNSTLGVKFTGAATGSFETKITSQTIDFNSPSASTSVTISGKVPTDTSGYVTFQPGVINLSAKIDGAVAGVAEIGTLTLTCNASDIIARMRVQIPGAPNTPATIDAPPIAGGYTAGIPIIGRSDINPDDGNPIQPETLKVVRSEGGAFVKNGWLVQPTTEDGGVLTNDLELCAPSRPVPQVDGTDEVQSLEWGAIYTGAKPLNAHPLSMTLKFGDQETKAISLTTNVLGNEVLGQFSKASAGTVQKALEALPNIGAGNIKVASTANGYSFTFAGKLAWGDQPQITIGTWRTHAPYEQFGKIQAAIQVLTAPAPPADPNAPPDPGATDLNVDQLWQQLITGAITSDQFSAKFGSAFGNSLMAGIPVTAALELVNNLYPAIPLTATGTIGVPLIPATETGPLCSVFQVKTVAVSKVFLFFLWLRAHPEVLGCQQTRVPYKARVKVAGKTRLVTRYKIVKSGSCAKKVVKKTVKKTVKKKR